jgi:dephospho-CoA kinase
MLEVGITGGIGSGKTTVSKIFETLGIPVFYADKVAKEIVDSDPEAKEEIIELLGEEAFVNGVYNTKYVAEQVFKNRDLLYALNKIIHPRVQQNYTNWKRAHTDKPYVLKEAAILIETQTHKELDVIILVTAPTELKIERIMKRDGNTREQVLARMDKQLSDYVKRSFAKFEIENDEKEPLIPKVNSIHETLIKQMAHC